MKNFKILVLISLIQVTGCMTQASLTLYSQPEGAYITEKDTGTSFGMSPAVIVYDPANLSRYRNSEGCYVVNGVQAKWVSGAYTEMETVKLCGRNYGDYNITISRDPSLPGLDKDMKFALEVQSIRAQQQQAQAARDAAAIQLWSICAQSNQA